MLVPARPTRKTRITRVGTQGAREAQDLVAVEEPLEIRVRYAGPEGDPPQTRSVSVTMRTPGQDFELAIGFLFGEGLISGRGEIHEITYCTSGEAPQEYNIVEVRLRPSAPFDPERLTRNFYMTSSCGVCGKASLEAIELRGCEPLADGGVGFSDELVRRAPERLTGAQAAFAATGGLHAAGLLSAEGELVRVAEDVGRHNAVDKVVGAEVLDGTLPASEHLLVVSGRASFEIVQKAVAARIPAVVAVGAPSSLAIDLARRFNVTLAGFTRPDGYNLYSGPERIGPA